MSHKKITCYFFVALLLFILLNFIIWKVWTEALLTSKYDGGDLARLGYVTGSKQFRKNVDDLPVRHIDMNRYDGRRIDVMTIGDSFSFGMGGGRNRYYQDYIATINNCTVLNVYPYLAGDYGGSNSPISTLSVLLGSGYLDIIKPRYLVIESVVRYCVHRFAQPLDLGTTDSLENVKKFYSLDTGVDTNMLPSVPFINAGNFKFVSKSILYRYSDNAFGKIIYRRPLTKDFFTASDANILLFYAEDVRNISLVTPFTVAGINDTFNRLAEVLERKGIKLYFMPVVDKYDLYSEYIIDNPYPKNPFFDELRKLPRKYALIDTKAILLPELKKGEKDVFFADDTHWNWKAAEKIFSTVRFP